MQLTTTLLWVQGDSYFIPKAPGCPLCLELESSETWLGYGGATDQAFFNCHHSLDLCVLLRPCKSNLIASKTLFAKAVCHLYAKRHVDESHPFYINSCRSDHKILICYFEEMIE